MFLSNLENDDELKEIVFEFFYYFSRFEFSLKENGYIKNNGKLKYLPNGVSELHKASADWVKFKTDFEKNYIPSKEALDALKSAPKVQVIDKNNLLDFVTEYHHKDASDLSKVIFSINRIRNNLFHGGKHGAKGEDDLERNRYLLQKGKIILDQLSKFNSSIEVDYHGGY